MTKKTRLFFSVNGRDNLACWFSSIRLSRENYDSARFADFDSTGQSQVVGRRDTLESWLTVLP
jgi:hypothetical protein